ncbi:hypothetical protein SAMN05216203_0138 [Marinobacter daqiaonensis]|uniref:Mut7-C RNAse domain-containing protein n=1 Tax=Marinobacter daqiaonensis TaxID=650891 RepID=A0A1I6GIM6_9GAMM|nr:Mut7-C RNAse domain-containing protein [Marinobacter daqiaonensis]SFR41981.1 hypothetical protein SAMN05216203_0138 [Marinobacter daqiaonensis]
MPGPHSETRFAADAMLGRLARWLRALGYDTRYSATIDDHDLVELSDRESRILLTRDRHLVTFLRPRRSVLLESGSPLSQLREVAEACPIEMKENHLFTRCLLCNAPLHEVTATEIANRVPEESRNREGPFLCCPECGRVFWYGSHVRRMRATLERVFPSHHE